MTEPRIGVVYNEDELNAVHFLKGGAVVLAVERGWLLSYQQQEPVARPFDARHRQLAFPGEVAQHFRLAGQAAAGRPLG